MFYELMKALREPLQLDKIGFYVSHYPYYRRFRERTPEIESGEYSLLKEWEITCKARNGKPNLDLIQQYEQKLGNPHLWGPLVADRRVYLGRKCTFFQDYRSRFDHNQMLNILQAGLLSMERLFDALQPSFVVSFICVTFGEYLAYLFALARGIPFLNLRPTRIENYMTYGKSPFEPSERIHAVYERYLTEGIEDDWKKRAGEYIGSVRTGHALYEGVIMPEKASSKNSSLIIQRLPKALFGLLRDEYDYRFGKVKDNHNPGVLVPLYYGRLSRPMRLHRIHRRLSLCYVDEDELKSLDYVFFPLHKEPEVTLQVYSTPYLNQIEVIRNISHSIPVGLTLVVKEHPASIGKRPLSYYQKIIDIPNVRLADPNLPSKLLIHHARLVATISGGIGWEAVIRQKPVVIFGHTPYEFLPDSMVRRVTDLEKLGEVIDYLLRGYDYQEDSITAYIAAVMSQSVPINFYSALLGRQGVYTVAWDGTDADQVIARDIETLAQYTIASLKDYGRAYRKASSSS